MSNKTLDLLFGSKTRVKILKSLFRNSGKDFNIQEMADLTQTKPVEVKKEVNLLVNIGLLKKFNG